MKCYFIPCQRLCLFLLSVLFFITLHGSDYVFNFSESDYSFRTDKEGLTNISGSFRQYLSEDDSPALPYTIRTIALPYGSVLEEYEVTHSSPRLVSKAIQIPSCSPCLPVSSIADGEGRVARIRYSEGIYPYANCERLVNSCIGGIYLERFSFNPFIYDSEKKELYFIDEFTLSIKIKVNDQLEGNTRDMEDIVSSIFASADNKDELNDIISQVPEPTYYYGDSINYLIITSPELEESFHKLVNWKRIRGVFSGIITTDEINSRYDGNDLQEKIKKCIYDAHTGYGLHWVVLGGDDTIVPSRGVYGQAPGLKTWEYEYAMPCDKYYGCFNGDFYWDANGNNIYGELDDDVDFTEFVYVSRVPVRTNEQAEAFISKLINYESGKDSQRLQKIILTSGVAKWDVYPAYGNRSDTDLQGDILYEEHIQPYWKGERVRFYDTGTDFPGGASFDVTCSNLQSLLDSDGMFFSIGTHGNYDRWNMEKEDNYLVQNAGDMDFLSFPIITTEACLTNKFDAKEDPCLSEAFIRNPNNGVVAYLGSSRYGFGRKMATSIGPSLQYEGNFYQQLLTAYSNFAHIGSILWAAKNVLIGETDYYSTFRWLQMSINLIGDSEMPVFTAIPIAIEKPHILYASNVDMVSIRGYGYGSRISIMSVDDNGESYHEVQDNGYNLQATIPKYPVIISISQHNHTPYLYYIDKTKDGKVIKGEVSYTIDGFDLSSLYGKTTEDINLTADNFLSCTYNPDTQQLHVEINEQEESSYRIELRGINGGSDTYSNLSKDILQIDMSDKPDGIYLVSLISENIGYVSSKKIRIY